MISPAITKIELLVPLKESKTDSALRLQRVGRPARPRIDPVRRPQRRHNQRNAKTCAKERREDHRPLEQVKLHLDPCHLNHFHLQSSSPINR